MSHIADKPLRVIGVGSPFGGDTVGLQAIERLRDATDIFPSGTELLALDRPGSNLISSLENTKAVALIDAMHSGQAPGTVQRLRLADLLAEAKHPSSHSLGVAEALVMAQVLEILPETLFIYGIEVDENESPGSWYAELLSLLGEDVSGQ